MTQSEFLFLEQFYKQAKYLRDKLNTWPEVGNISSTETYAELRLQLDELDLVHSFMEYSTSKKELDKSFTLRVASVQRYILQQTNGIVILPEKIIIGIIEKSVI